MGVSVCVGGGGEGKWKVKEWVVHFCFISNQYSDKDKEED